MPKGFKARTKFVKDLAAKSAARMAAGGTALILVLLSVSEAEAASSNVNINSIEGVSEVEMLSDGSARVTLDNGTKMILPKGSFVVAADGQILVNEGTAQLLAENAAGEGGGEVATGAIVAGGLLLAGAAAGGGGGSSSGGSDGGSTPTPTASGTVVDGYIVNATVFQDVNGNEIFDAGEPNTITQADGSFDITLDPSAPTAKLISFGGTDSSTGQAFTGTLTAPAGSEVITPLTTLVQSIVEQSEADGTPISVQDANDQLATALGLSGQDLLELDPVAEIEDNGNPEAFAAAAQVASIISAAAAANEDTEAGSAEASEAAAASLAQQLLAAGSDSEDLLNDESAIQQALEDAGVSTEEAEDVAAQVEEANTLIDNAADGSGTAEDIQATIETVQEVVQGDLVDAIEDENTDVNSLDVTDTVADTTPIRPVVTTQVTSDAFGSSQLAGGVTVAGTGRAGSLVQVTIDGEVKTTTVTGQGAWSVSFAEAELPSETGAFEVEVAGAPSGSTIFTSPVSGGTLNVDLTGPDAPQFDSIATNDVLELEEQDSTLSVSGTAEAFTLVTVTVGSASLQVAADQSGAFAVVFNAEQIPASDFNVTAQATDILGNVGEIGTAAVTVEPVSALTPTVNAVSGVFGQSDLASGLDVSGTGRPNSTITVSIDGEEQSTQVGNDGTWTVSFAEGNLPDATGSYAVSAVASLQGTSFSSGSVSGGSLTVDLDAAGAPIISVVAVNNVLELEEQGANLTVEGNAEANATVAVTIGTTVETTTADGNGAFSVSFDAGDVPTLDFQISATATDAQNNVSPAGTRSVSVEPVSALEPTVDAVTDTLGIADRANGLEITGTGRPGSTVTVTIDSVSETGSVNNGGVWSVTFAEGDLPNADGASPISTVGSLQGTSFASDPVSGGNVTLDLTAPSAPTIDAVTGDDFIATAEQGSDLTISGTAEAGTQVTVIVGVPGRPVSDQQTVMADNNGAFSVTVSSANVPSADFSVQATAQDENGNDSQSASRNVTIQPGGSVVNGDSGANTLDGTAGNDTIDPMGNDGSFDIINGSAGNDQIILTNSGGTGYVELDYSNLTGPVTATVDFANNTGSVSKGSDGTDTLVNPTTVGEANGLGVIGTAGNDVINVAQSSDFTWFGAFYGGGDDGGGDDTVNVTLDAGIVRVNAPNLNDEDASVNLVTGVMTSSAGSVQLNTSGSAANGARIEVETQDGNDSVLGSDANERFILGAGTDTLDAGDGYDVLRYDRTRVQDGVTVNLETGVATGTWDGKAFTHNISGVEEVRGSRNDDDDLTASATGSHLIGRGGDDILRGGTGDDIFLVGHGNDTIFGFDL